MKLVIMSLAILVLLLNLTPLLTGAMEDSATELLREDRVVEQMRGLNMQPSAAPMGNGAIAANEQLKLATIERLHSIGKEATPVLNHALSDSDVQMRRNAVLVFSFLAGGFDERPKMDIRGAILKQHAKTKAHYGKAYCDERLHEHYGLVHFPMQTKWKTS